MAVQRSAAHAVLIVIAVTFTAAFGGIASRFAPDADLWPRWQVYDPASTIRVDHRAWDVLVDRYLSLDGDGIARFAYAGVTAEDRRALDAYVDALAITPVDSLNRPEQLAYWINLYNALTVQLVLAHWPVDSIRDIDISPGLFRRGPWDAKLVTVAGEELSLNDIEHRILRPIWRDPRIHYAVNCAAIGCPNLQREAFTAANTFELFDQAARAFVNHPRGVRLEGDRLIVSSIYAWFREDFGDSAAGVLDHLRVHADPALAALLAGRTTIDDHAYDWSINAAPGG
ncbi:MAG: DUF547 domain-containing protein [Rhodospirillales bacterium]|nr:MAG: DUF547 domain-containing protein [Rhodospirillales bacterium]